MTSLACARAWALCAALGLLAGCATVPDVGPKPVPAAADSLESRASFAGAEGQWPAEGWWEGLGDAQLDTLVAEGLKGSPDVVIAAARVRAADAMAQQAGAALLPRVGAEASAGGVGQKDADCTGGAAHAWEDACHRSLREHSTAPGNVRDLRRRHGLCGVRHL